MSISFEPTKVKFGQCQRSKSGILAEQREKERENKSNVGPLCSSCSVELFSFRLIQK